MDKYLDAREREENEKNFDDYLEEAQNGNAKAQMIVGSIYYIGNSDVNKDCEKRSFGTENMPKPVLFGEINTFTSTACRKIDR